MRISITLLVISGCLLWIVGTKLIAPYPARIGPPPITLNAETVSFKSHDGANISGWYAKGAQQDKTVILLHPKGGTRLAMLDRALLFQQAGYSVLLIDLQAHGESEGKHFTAGYLEKHDAEAAVAFIKRRFPEGKIVVVGSSLGGAAAVLASPMDIDALILESVYSSIEDALNNRLRMRLGRAGPILTPLLLVQLKLRLGISKSDLRPMDFSQYINCPVLIISGDNDNHTTRNDTIELYNRASSPKSVFWFRGAGHVDLYKYDRSLYEQTVLKFIQKEMQ